MSLATSCLDGASNGESSDTHFRVVEGVVETADTVRLEDGSLCTYSGLDLTVGKEYVFVIEVNGKCVVRSAVKIVK